MKKIYLDPVPVRYSGSVPSMNRRGGVRVHPIKDGGINPESSSQYIRTRDFAGNKLRDVVDPSTGFVTDVVSNLESGVVNFVGREREANDSISGGATGTLKYLASKVRVDSAGNKVYLDEAGRRIRTTDMGETPGAAVPRAATPDRSAKTRKRGGSVAGRPVKSAKPTVPGGTGTGGRITDDDVKNYIRALARTKGYPEPTVFTHTMIRDGREALKLRRKQAELALRKLAGE